MIRHDNACMDERKNIVRSLDFMQDDVPGHWWKDATLQSDKCYEVRAVRVLKVRQVAAICALVPHRIDSTSGGRAEARPTSGLFPLYRYACLTLCDGLQPVYSE